MTIPFAYGPEVLRDWDAEDLLLPVTESPIPESLGSADTITG
jgi:hypothetical protein